MKKDACALRAELPQTGVRVLQVVAAVRVVLQDEFYIGRIAANVHILTAHLLNEPGKCPHADAPGVAWVLTRDDLVSPHPLRLIRDRPEVRSTPDQRCACLLVDKLCAHPVRAVMIALEVAVARSFARTHRNSRTVRLRVHHQ